MYINILEISYSYKAAIMIRINTHLIPKNETIEWYFDTKKSFGDLKNDLEEEGIIRKDKYYFDYIFHIMNDNMKLKDNGVEFNSKINAIDNVHIKINLSGKNEKSEIQRIQNYTRGLCINVIKADENKEINVYINDNNFFLYYSFNAFIIIKNKEIKRVIGLLKEESSDYLSILKDLVTVYEKCFVFYTLKNHL